MRNGVLKLHILILASLLACGIAGAETLRDIQLPLPADNGAIRAKCALAFQQSLADKEAYENRPEVNVQCAHYINRKQMKELEMAFMRMCQTVTEVEAQVASGAVVIPTDMLQRGFNNVYGVIFRRDCLDRAVSKFNQQQAPQRAAHASSGGGSAVSERCHAFLGCGN